MHVEIMFLNEGLILWTLKTFILVDPDDHFNGDDDQCLRFLSFDKKCSRACLAYLT